MSIFFSFHIPSPPPPPPPPSFSLSPPLCSFSPPPPSSFSPPPPSSSSSLSPPLCSFFSLPYSYLFTFFHSFFYSFTSSSFLFFSLFSSFTKLHFSFFITFHHHQYPHPFTTIHSPPSIHHHLFTTIHSPPSIHHHPFTTIHSPPSIHHHPFTTIQDTRFQHTVASQHLDRRVERSIQSHYVLNQLLKAFVDHVRHVTWLKFFSFCLFILISFSLLHFFASFNHISYHSILIPQSLFNNFHSSILTPQTPSFRLHPSSSTLGLQLFSIFFINLLFVLSSHLCAHHFLHPQLLESQPHPLIHHSIYPETRPLAHPCNNHSVI